MKKGIVMEKHHDYVIVMRKDGAFQKAWPLENAAVGMEVSYRSFTGERRPLLHDTEKKRHIVQLVATTCMLLLLMPIYFMMGEEKTYAYVNLTIHPNFELEIDNRLNIKSIAALNGDAESVLTGMADYEGDQLEDVMKRIMSESEEANLLQNGKNMLAGVSYILDSHQVSVTQAIDDFMEHEQGWDITTFQIPKEIWEVSRDNEQSMNELMATNLIGTEVSTVKKEDRAVVEPFVDNDERDIIHSFYNNHDHDSGAAAKNKSADETEGNIPTDHNVSKD